MAETLNVHFQRCGIEYILLFITILLYVYVISTLITKCFILIHIPTCFINKRELQTILILYVMKKKTR